MLGPEEEFTKREVWLAPGRWINAFTGQVFEGKEFITESFSLDQYPIYIKEGSIIPTMKPRDYIDSKAYDAIALNIYPAKGQIRFFNYACKGIYVSIKKIQANLY